MSPNDFCVFILTHGRPNKVITYNVIRRQGYTGPVRIILDNEDATLEQYRANFPANEIVVFDKAEMGSRMDEGDNSKDRRTITWARNASFDIAKAEGFRYFIQLDDDYSRFHYRFDDRYRYCEKPIKNLDAILCHLLDFYKSTSFASIAIAQNGDYIGGSTNGYMETIGTRRKAMNTFICDTKRPFLFRGRFNEDVNTYTSLQRAGVSNFLTILGLSVKQGATQSNEGGITELYRENGTYVKSFYTVMYAPSATKIGKIGPINPRLHHRIKWDAVAPKILNEKYRQAAI